MRKPVIIAYDIRSNKNRSRVRKILQDWKLDGQKSVCECFLSRNEAEELVLQISSYIDRTSDNILIAWLAPDRPVLKIGLGGKNSTPVFKRFF
jgi:CRISPR-associated protein Cas2